MKISYSVVPYYNQNADSMFDAESREVADAFIAGYQRGNPNAEELTVSQQYTLNGMVVPGFIVSATRALYSHGAKVEGIKLVRAYSRVGLKEAKDFCEALPVLGGMPKLY